MAHRLPSMKADVSGAAMKNPARFKDRPAPSGMGALGDPDPTLTPAQQAAWRQYAATLPWLDASHRTLVRIASLLTARLDDPGVGLNAIAALSAVLSKMGATPVDSSKVAALAQVEDDPAERFFSGAH
jgi:hypothetical protein